MTDFSHLHALEERAVRIRERMIDVQKNDAQWKAQAVQLFQTEKEIADEREFLGLEDMSTDDLYAGLIEEHESEVVREVTAMANAAEQAEQIRTAAEALVLKLKDFEYEEWAGNPEISFSDFVEVELTALKEALSRGWLSRGKADRPLWEKHKEQERQALIAALAERDRLDPDAPKAIVFKESSDSEQLRNTQNALRNLWKAVQKSRSVNDPLGMATAMEEAGRWF